MKNLIELKLLVVDIFIIKNVLLILGQIISLTIN